MLTIQHTNNTHTVEQQWEFYSALTLIIDIQGRPTVCTRAERVRNIGGTPADLRRPLYSRTTPALLPQLFRTTPAQILHDSCTTPALLPHCYSAAVRLPLTENPFKAGRPHLKKLQ